MAINSKQCVLSFVQINMQRKMRFTGIVTQGASRMGSAEFIKAFKVASSLDGRTYTVYRLDGQKKDNVSEHTHTPSQMYTQTYYYDGCCRIYTLFTV